MDTFSLSWPFLTATKATSGIPGGPIYGIGRFGEWEDYLGDRLVLGASVDWPRLSRALFLHACEKGSDDVEAPLIVRLQINDSTTDWLTQRPLNLLNPNGH